MLFIISSIQSEASHMLVCFFFSGAFIGLGMSNFLFIERFPTPDFPRIAEEAYAEQTSL